MVRTSLPMLYMRSNYDIQRSSGAVIRLICPGASAGSSSPSVGGQTLALSYALDQANLSLPKSLVGSEMVVVMRVQFTRDMRWLTFVLLAYCGVASAQTVSFRRPVAAYQSGASRGANICSNCVAVADFNGDGKPDIVYAVTEFTPFTGVVLGNGDGTFRPGVQFPVNQSLGRPVAADFNGDGKMDVVISGSRTWIYMGNGDGTFVAPLLIDGCASTSSYALNAIGDFNRDGKMDLFCGKSVLLSNGDGTFREAGVVDVNLQEVGLLAADFNGDGIPDLLLQQLSGKLAIAIGNGDGTFRPDLVVATQPSSLSAFGVLVGDFNGDGRMDLAGFGIGNAFFVYVLPGNGDGTFGTVIQTALSSGVPGTLSAAADFNGDGKFDLVAGDAVLLGKGDGTFRFPVFFGTVTSACGEAATPTIPTFYPCNLSHNATAIADFNGDGLSDIAAGTVVFGPQNTSFSSVSVLLNDGSGDGFTATGVSSASLVWPVAPGSIVSAFGVNLAQTTATADVGFWFSPGSFPTTLGGIRLHVQDRSHVGDMLAQLLFVSPGQINYIMPSSDPFAFVAIERVGATYTPKGVSVPIAPVAPGLYNAVRAVRVDPDGTQTYVSVNPIDLSGRSPVYLVLYGTGFSTAVSAMSNCGASSPAQPKTVVKLDLSYAGPELLIQGLDQANLVLPKSLAGAGTVYVSCQFSDGQVARATNPIQISIQ